MAGHNGNPGGAGGGNAGGNKGGSGGGKAGKGALATVGALVLALAAAWLGIDGTGGTDGGTDGGGSRANGPNANGNGGNGNHADGNRNNSNGNHDNSNGNGNHNDGGGTRLCPIDTLPPQTDDVVDRILTNQDHIYSTHDGKHFGNYEGVLPKQHGSYYREYTVDTPGLNHRGARRIVVGGGTEDDPDVWYYTDDHFESFCEIPDAED